MTSRTMHDSGATTTVDFAALSVENLVAFRDTPTFQTWLAEVPALYQTRITRYIDALIDQLPADS